MNVRETLQGARAVEWELSHSFYSMVLADAPATLFPYWAGTAHHEFPGIARDASFYAQSIEGLMMFFDCVAAAGRTCALPSRAADAVWHAWTRMDAASLDRFCICHFGGTIPHVEGARMQEAMDKALGACLVQARRRVSQRPAGPHLPRLFTLDAQLGMPRGLGYRVINGKVAYSVLDEFGNPQGGVSFPHALTPEGLLKAGLISKAEYFQVVDVLPATCAAWNGAANDLAVDGCGEGGDGASGDGGGACGGGCGGGGGGGGCGS